MINFGALQQGGGFQNALATGLQLGAMARQRQDEREFRNALTQFDPNNPETLKPIMAARPEVGMQLQGQMQQQQRAAQEAELTQRAIGGDPQALEQLATVNFDKWKGLDARQKAAAAQESKVFGDAALSLSQVPYGQRRDLILAYAQQMPQFAEQINEIAFLPEAEQNNALRVAVTEAGLIQKLIDLEQPDYQPLGPDQVFVNVRDPAAVGQFSAGGAPQGGGGFVEGQTATNPATGQKIVFRNGAWRPM
jgi:hypothetical protein